MIIRLETGILSVQRLGRSPTAVCRRVSTDDFFKGKRVAIFAVPGAFTSTCSVEALCRVSPTMPMRCAQEGHRCRSLHRGERSAVMRAWGQQEQGRCRNHARTAMAISRALGVEADMTKNGMGRRSRRYSMLVEDGVVKQFNWRSPALSAFRAAITAALLTDLSR
jgi:peroxiredoxin